MFTLISGTAPDLSTRGKAALSSQIDQFFEPLGDIVELPNPFNTEDSVPRYLDADIRDRLINGPWRDTFIDNLASGYDEALRNYYAIPVSNWGSFRLFYNQGQMRRAKDLLLGILLSDQPRPDWLEARLIPAGGSTRDGFLPENEALYDWIRSDEPPNTLGRLLLISDAIWELARAENRPFLVPIAGSSYTREVFADRYGPTFQNPLMASIDLNMDSIISPAETFGGWRTGKWSFEHPAMEGFFETLREIALHFPRGFLGLDREQANRRFIMQNATMLLTGAWDATSTFALAENQANPFQVGVTTLPVPGPGERFHEFANLPPSEAAQTLGVPMQLYKLSVMKEEAIDFLRFLTSYQGNSKFTRLSGWLPATIGVEPIERMRPFLPVTRGVTSHYRLNMVGGNVGTAFRSQMFGFISGDFTYEEFVNNVETAMSDPRMGVNRLWHEQFLREAQQDRSAQMSLSTQLMMHLTHQDQESIQRYNQLFLRSLSNSNGLNTRQQWRRFFPDEPEPQF
ncbi:MAG: hypothetical protein LR015_05520 [Verrucomicrobia bacterium]|nr:hypothetical protein [Verrucomicrobiota bacterium]